MQDARQFKKNAKGKVGPNRLANLSDREILTIAQQNFG
jgi:hypothetical protein